MINIVVFFSMFLAVIIDLQYNQAYNFKKSYVVKQSIRNIKNLEIEKTIYKCTGKDTAYINLELINEKILLEEKIKR